MRYLLFDTETTGLPRNWRAPVEQVDNWPRLVQVAYLMYDESGVKIGGDASIIIPGGYEIPSDVAVVHGITQERALREGREVYDVLQELYEAMEACDVLVAHNMDFDSKIIGSEFIRHGIPNIIESRKRLCTMRASADLVGILGPRGYKWPKLSELYVHLFRENFDGAHNAEADIRATARCFWELKRRGVL